MKKIILTAAAVFAFSFANAQDGGFAKGNLFLRGDVSFGKSSTGNFDASASNFSPGIGYFVSDNVAIVGSLSIGSQDAARFEETEDGILVVDQSTFAVSAGVRYLFTPASKFSFSLGADISSGSVKESVEDFEETQTLKTFAFSLPVGLNYFVSNKLALTAELGGLSYSTNDNGGDGAEETTSTNIGLSMSNVRFGLVYKL
jgi:hypothetical protein